MEKKGDSGVIYEDMMVEYSGAWWSMLLPQCDVYVYPSVISMILHQCNVYVLP